jgi:glycosyltransferase involved in cell wall biosynthesis
MRIVYHHRTRATDAQRIHILEIVKAFRALGNEVCIVSLVSTEGVQDTGKESKEATWKRIARKVPFAYEAIQLGYNLIGIPFLLWKVVRWKPRFIYERYSLFNFTGVVVAWLTRRVLILEVNSPFFLEQKADNDIRAARFAAWTELVICRAATKVIVVTHPLKRIMESLGVETDRLVVMTNGVNPVGMRSAADSGELRGKLGLSGRVVIGFVGWFKKWHGLEFLLEVFKESDLRESNVSLLLIGDGPAMTDLQSYVLLNGLEKEVVFTGALPHAEVSRYLDVIDIAVQPAANEYCCPMKILEYMSLGKPLVAPRQENIEELVRAGREAELFEPNDHIDLSNALRRMVHDPAMRLYMGRNAQEAIETRGFLWMNNAKRVIDLAEIQ